MIHHPGSPLDPSQPLPHLGLLQQMSLDLELPQNYLVDLLILSLQVIYPAGPLRSQEVGCQTSRQEVEVRLGQAACCPVMAVRGVSVVSWSWPSTWIRDPSKLTCLSRSWCLSSMGKI